MAKIRFFKSSSTYPTYIEQFYAKRQGLSSECHAVQVASILNDGFSFGDSWKHYLEATGQFDVTEVITNAEVAQKQWAKERSVEFGEKTWGIDILTAQLLEFEPHVWFCHGSMTPMLRSKLRQLCPSIKYVIGYDGSLRHNPDEFRGCDAVLSCVKRSAEFYSNSGFDGVWLRWGFDPRVLARLSAATKACDASFCGSIVMQPDVQHFGRARLLGHLNERERFGIDLRCADLMGYKTEIQLAKHLLKCRFDVVRKMLRTYPTLLRLRTVNQSACFGLEMFQVIANSRVALNLHGDGVTTAANIRMFEVTGVGTCLLTDWKQDLGDLFEPDREVVAFKSPDECAEKLRYLLDHSETRSAIALAGQKRCLTQHNIGKHIQEFAGRMLVAI